MTAKNRSWTEFYDYGTQYMHTVEKSVRNKDVFTPVIVYNMSAIAIEKLIMGACLYHGKIPYCHTLSGMADFAGGIMGFDDKLVEDLCLMDSMQMICSEDDKSSRKPADSDVPFFIDVMKRVFVKTELFLESGN